MTRYLCELAAVSPSGYYRWRAAEEVRQLRAVADGRDIALIKEHFHALRGKAGALMIKMRLEHVSGVVMNHKKIRRLMRIAGLVAALRQANPYRKMAKGIKNTRLVLTFLSANSTRVSRRRSSSLTLPIYVMGTDSGPTFPV